MSSPETSVFIRGIKEIEPPHRNVAFVHPGQGTQEVGMGRDLHDSSETVRRLFRNASEVLGYDLRDLCFNGPQEKLTQTEYAQPAIVAVSLAATFVFAEKHGGELELPQYLAGHSLGEITALILANCLSIEDAISLVKMRGSLMQEAGKDTEGGMAAIFGLEKKVIEKACLETGTGIAGINYAGQVVITGKRMRLAESINLLQDLGAKRITPLKVSGAFHDPESMEHAAGKLRESVQKIRFNDPDIPVISNITGKPLTKAEEIPGEIWGQLINPVQWLDSVTFMKDNGINVFIELGPGNVLAGMVRKIVSKGEKAVSINSLADVNNFSPANMLA